MKIIALIILSTLFTSCALMRDHVAIGYKPCCTPQTLVGAENIVVAVNVNDCRVKNNLGCKSTNLDVEMANIMAKNDVAQVFKDAVIWELQQRGFVVANGGSYLSIELCKFFNDFKEGFFSASANSETVLNVSLRNKDGALLYAKTIFGFGGEETCFVVGGNNASLALERSLQNAIQRLMNDPDFIWALLASN